MNNPFNLVLVEGEVWVGISLEGEPHHVILLSATPDKDLKWQEALAWAKSVGGELPTRREQSVMFGNRREGQYQNRWYWSCEQSAGNDDYAWVQGFYYGGQSYDRNDTHNRARAVRRVPIGEGNEPR